MTDEEQADYNKAFANSFRMHVANGTSEDAMEMFLEGVREQEFYDMYGWEYYTPLADARGMFADGYELGIKQCIDKLKRNGVI
jgi:hypothetical protein